MAKIDEKLSNEIDLYCKINEISDPNKFLTDLVEKTFSVIKYGNKPDIRIEPKKEENKPEPDNKEEKIITLEENTLVVQNNIKINDNYNDIYDI
jgi:TnpA family transposase